MCQGNAKEHIGELWTQGRGQHLVVSFLTYALKIDTPESFIVLFVHYKN